MTTLADQNPLLDSRSPSRTAGALPSSRTEGMFYEAMASDSIEEVKVELAHTRAHYQSLEFMLNGLDTAGEPTIAWARAEGFLANDAEAAGARAIIRLIALDALDAAYNQAHQTEGEDVPAELRALYPGLNFEDPARQDALADFLRSLVLRGETARFETATDGETEDTK